MLRCYLGTQLRLHVWHDSLVFDPPPSDIHTHPWHLQSLIVGGRLMQTRYAEVSNPDESSRAHAFQAQRIKCGEGGGLDGDPFEVYLNPMEEEVYGPGDTYSQRAYEIHRSAPQNGTTTLCDRKMPPFGDPDHAVVFWQSGDWVSAEPRPATTEEIETACMVALGRLEDAL